MSLYIGNDKIGSLYLGSTKIKEAWVGDVKVYGSGDPYNPLDLPPFTIRCKFEQGYDPRWSVYYRLDSYELVDETNNIWDLHKNSTDWSELLYYSREVLEVLGANTTGVTNMRYLFFSTPLTSIPLFDTSSCTNMSGMFETCISLTTVPLFDTSHATSMGEMFSNCYSLTSVPLFNTSSCTNMFDMFMGCRSLTSVPLFNTSSCTNMYGMFSNCSVLTSIPLFDTSSCTDMNCMFDGCVNVQYGALALYQQASTQANVPNHGAWTFYNCGINTPTGLAELQQIPPSWGGLAPG